MLVRGNGCCICHNLRSLFFLIDCRNWGRRQHSGTQMSSTLRWSTVRLLVESIGQSMYIAVPPPPRFAIVRFDLPCVSILIVPYVLLGLEQISILKRNFCCWKIKIWDISFRVFKVKKRFVMTSKLFIANKSSFILWACGWSCILFYFGWGHSTENRKVKLNTSWTWYQASEQACLFCWRQV